MRFQIADAEGCVIDVAGSRCVNRLDGKGGAAQDVSVVEKHRALFAHRDAADFRAVFGELENLERKKALQHGATLSVSKKLLSDTLELSLSGVLGLNDFDSFIKPVVTYSLSDQINLSAGAYVFIPGPDRDGQYGSYKDLSTGYLRCKYCF